ncbi:hypothetical protein FQA39_LY04208 [Lamprigera yunnana]|nr:hypothetical protein FQA39_LY04208 [Lamprigera yunnana]
MSEELSIKSIREYIFLYDPSDAGYHENKKKDNAWTQISEKYEGWTEQGGIDINKDHEDANKYEHQINDELVPKRKGTSKVTRNVTTPVAQVLQEYLQTKNNTKTEGDAIEAFFKAMEQTVRTFPLPLQIDIKGKISNLDNEYEVKNYNTQRLYYQEESPIVYNTEQHPVVAHFINSPLFISPYSQ